MNDGIEGMIVGYTCGVYDMFHIGHLNMLRNARALCDKLIVGLTTDEAVSYKNKKCVIPYDQRKLILESVKYVDLVVAQEDHNKVNAYEKLKYDKLFVGDDWYGHEKWKEWEEELMKNGVKVIYFPYTKSISTSILKSKKSKNEYLLLFEINDVLWNTTTEELYEDVTDIVMCLKNNNYNIGVLSCSKHKKEFTLILKKNKIYNYFDMIEIIDTQDNNKKEHIENIRIKNSFALDKIVIFEKKNKNMESVNKTGVIYNKIENGLTWKNIFAGIEEILFR